MFEKLCFSSFERRALVKSSLCFLLLFSTKIFSQAVGVTAPAASGTYCAGATGVNVTFTVTGSFLNTPVANVFSAQISDPSGNFGGTPATIGTIASTAGGVISCTFPSTLLTSNLYRVRVIANNPPINGSDNGANLTFFSIALNQPTVASTSLCRSETFTVNFSTSTCDFVNLPSNNIFSVELSNSAGNFSSPTVIGTRVSTTTGTIACTIPPAQAAGAGYRIRIVSTSPALTSVDNGVNIAILAPTGNPNAYGTSNWLVHCFATRDNYTNDYKGFYTETSLNFNTTTRWSVTSNPSLANSTGGSAYTGCSVPTGTYSFSYKRTNIACGYYRVDIPQHRNEVYMLINGAVVFQHSVCCDAHTNAWTGIIQNTDSLEFRASNSGTHGFLQVTFSKINELTVSPPIRVCSASNASLTAVNNGTLPLTYAWTPAATVTSPTQLITIANPTSNTTFTISSFSGTCAVFTNSIVVTVSPAPAPAVAISSATICNGQTVATMTATGGQTYTWQPATGLSSTTGNTVIASPPTSTNYTLTASNNCSTLNVTRTVVVQSVPSTPLSTVFGNNVWNVYTYSNSTASTQFGFYTENNLSFTTTPRWASTPSSANAASGTAYQGCIIAAGNHALYHKRTNFPCGYYAITLNHDESISLLVNGVQVFSHATANHIDPGVWTGFLGPLTTLEIRQLQTGSASSLAVTFSSLPYPDLSPPVTICAGTGATLVAVTAPGLSYSWTPSAFLNTTTSATVISNATSSTIYTCTVTDALTGCTAANSNTVTVSPAPTTNASPLTPTINCSAEVYTIIATGANTYTWLPATGLSTNIGYSVVANPSVSTIYTVSGSNNCSVVSQTINISVVPLVSTTVFPSSTWNAYCFATTTYSNYYGYYTENGAGASGYDINTTARWPANQNASNANAANGLDYRGCALPATNWSMIFKRTNFACNSYSVRAFGNDDNLVLFINNTQVAARGLSTNSVILWSGVLTTTSTVEIRLLQNAGTSSLNIVFEPEPASTKVWAGSTSTNWFTSSNWCGGSQPTTSDDVIIPAGGAVFKPAIPNNSTADCRNLIIMPAVAGTSTLAAIGAASLTFSGPFDLEVFGDWTNNGILVQGTGRVMFLGNSLQTISSAATQTFHNLQINNPAGVVFTPGIHRVSGNLNLLNGIATSNGTLQLLNAAITTSASNASYVVGSVTKFGNQAFTFPIGGNNFYRPVSISAPVLATDNFRAEYFPVDPGLIYNPLSKDVTIDHIGRCEYWTIDRTGGSSILNVTLSWDAPSCGVNNLPDLVVSRWDAGQIKWKDQGNGGSGGTTSTGTVISSGPITAFSPFTLASRSPLNPLPVVLKEFTSQCSADSIQIKWTTASEKNNAHFVLERSTDALNWLEVARLPASFSGGGLYSITEKKEHATNYYRLTQADLDGKRKTFPIIVDNCPGDVEDALQVYPVPVKDEMWIAVSCSKACVNGLLQIRNSTGVLITTELLTLPAGKSILRRQLNLPSGLYSISFSSASMEIQTRKVIVE